VRVDGVLPTGHNQNNSKEKNENIKNKNIKKTIKI
jgi:hypothetical protein